MRTFIITLLLVCFSGFVYAAENCSTQSGAEVATEKLEINTDVPKFLEGATVCVKLADKTESCVPAEKYKVVPRQQQFIVTKTYRKSVTTCKADQLRNRISLHAGKGPNGRLENNVNSTNTQTDVENVYGNVGAIQYQYLFTDRWSLSGQVQSDNLKDAKTGLVGVGYDF